MHTHQERGLGGGRFRADLVVGQRAREGEGRDVQHEQGEGGGLDGRAGALGRLHIAGWGASGVQEGLCLRLGVRASSRGSDVFRWQSG